MKLFDVMGGPFIALPAEVAMDEDGSVNISMANIFGKADQPAEPAPVVTQQPEQPQVTTPGRVIPPWELAAQASKAVNIVVDTKVLTQGIAEEEEQVTKLIPVPWESPALMIQQVGRAERVLPGEEVAVTQVERGLPDGWGIDDPSRLLEVNGSKFANQEDADNWVIAKGRALPYSTKDESRPDP
jgi:hypothetical protein